MPDIGLFDVIGPWMVGPSSSHTAGACRMASTALKIFGKEPEEVKFTLYGSFAETYRGHGSDKALLGGVMGFDTFDIRIRDSFELAEKRGLKYRFIEDHETKTAHPNTVRIELIADGGESRLVTTAVSIGGGKIKIIRLDEVDVNFTGEFPTLILKHCNVPGVISYFTGILSDYSVNISSMRCYAEPDGKTSYSIIESEQPIGSEIIKDIRSNKLILNSILIQ
ncbi:MAG: L-serine ammonia-lyase, iron-sulfur-dependent subunit beta [Eubacteriales bacterium]|nr:L-serine ammonia-lyase, iron-sulfur-dependent subunit beta [Eubacteriales bacterium]MDD3882745.1 L-serine ammonia-lyase, iron-sulfur-dependent subunit beta [Eubacteriales bacterium]MDD4512634.1 L-serine ammonia-lyase, iron-sulfur-dependent subunit beta [Eubacteriales bacterium]